MFIATGCARCSRGLTIDMVDHNSKAGPYLPDAEAVVAFGVMLSDEIFSSGKNLKWVQALGSGVDGITDQPSFRKDIQVTNMQGLHGPPCAEAAICAMLDLARQMPRVLDNQRNKTWQRFPVRLVDGKQVAIIGLGVIAEALASALSGAGHACDRGHVAHRANWRGLIGSRHAVKCWTLSARAISSCCSRPTQKKTITLRMQSFCRR